MGKEGVGGVGVGGWEGGGLGKEGWEAEGGGVEQWCVGERERWGGEAGRWGCVGERAAEGVHVCVFLCVCVC